MQLECIPVGCVLPALYNMGGLPDRDPPLDRDLHWTETPIGQRPPGQRPPWTEIPLDKDPLDRHSPMNRIRQV